MIISRSFFVIVFFTVLQQAGNSWAQISQCKSDIKADKGNWHYQNRLGDDRCEGTYIRNHSGLDLRLVSFTANPIFFTSTKGGRLEIISPSLEERTSVSVQGNNFLMNETGNNPDYRLDMTLSEGSKKTIPLDDVINPLEITSSNIGFIGEIKENNQIVLIPLLIKFQSELQNNTVRWRDRDFFFLFTTQDYINKLSYSLVTNEKQPVTIIPSKVLGQNVDTDNLLKVVIHGTSLPSNKHRFKLIINYGGQSFPDTYYVYIP